jgi:hypothetical protein
MLIYKEVTHASLKDGYVLGDVLLGNFVLCEHHREHWWGGQVHLKRQPLDATDA